MEETKRESQEKLAAVEKARQRQVQELEDQKEQLRVSKDASIRELEQQKEE